jgi:hypothetical protein
MEKSTRIVSQVYGYAVCLVTVITFLISITALFTAVIDRSDPLHSGYNQPGSPSLASYENYKSDILKSNQKSADKINEAYVPDEQTLKVMYASARNDKIQSVQHNAFKSILISSLIILICIVLFFTHWKWMQRMART